MTDRGKKLLLHRVRLFIRHMQGALTACRCNFNFNFSSFGMLQIAKQPQSLLHESWHSVSS